MKKLEVFVLFVILTAATALAQEKERLVDFKSGIITMTSDLLGQTVITKKYYDDYGRKFAQFTMEPYYEDGERKDTLLIGRIRGDVNNIVVDYANKVLRVQSRDSTEINFVNLSEEAIKKYKIKRLGEEEVCEKPCVKYSFSYKSQGQNLKYQVWVWKGVTLKKRVKSLFLDYESEATAIQVDVPVDSTVFVVPDYPLEPWPEEAKR